MTIPQRNTAVDAVRTVALVGICVVNLPFIALPADRQFGLPAAPVDAAAVLAIEALFQAKFFLLFSFVFGWGIHVQQLSADRAGADFGRRYGRRLAALAGLGALHAVLVFSGDILVIYALVGLLVWPLRGATPRRLMRAAAASVPVALAALVLLILLLPAETPQAAGPGLGGSYAQAVRARIADWPGTFGFLLLLQGPLAFGAFAAGIAAAKVGYFDAGGPWLARSRRALPWLLAAGLPLNACYALAAAGLVPPDAPLTGLLCFAAIGLGGPLLAGAYLCAIRVMSERWRLPDMLVAAGRNSLSCYVLQGVLGGALFGAYGLGLFGRLGQAALLALGVAVALASMAVVGIIAQRAGRGPFEALLRRATYG